MQHPDLIIAQLIIKQLKEDLSATEQQALQTWLAESPAHRELLHRIMTGERLREDITTIAAIDTEAAGRQMMARLFPDAGRQPAVPRIPLYRKWIWAACLAGLLAAGAWFLVRDTDKNVKAVAGTEKQPPAKTAAGKEGAVLTLADGSKVLLDSLGNGIIAAQNGAEVRLKDGQVVYNAGKEATPNISYNTLATPRGKLFQVILPDGTRVWLNAESSIKYPTSFKKGAREVELTGEGYFEVRRNTVQPFFVKINNMEVQVLGTSFNVMAYPDEDTVETTLFEGSVRINCQPQQGLQACQATLDHPGQQGRISASGNLAVRAANMESVVAWRVNKFVFNGDNIKGIMRKIARWYDVEVIYEGDMANKDFVGSVSRSSDIKEVLRKLELTNIIKFRIEGKKVFVIP